MAPRPLDVRLCAELWRLSTVELRAVLRDHTTTGGQCQTCGPAPDISITKGRCRSYTIADETLRRRHELLIGGDATPPGRRRKPVDAIGAEQRWPTAADTRITLSAAKRP